MTASIDMPPSTTATSSMNSPTQSAMPLSPVSLDIHNIRNQHPFLPPNDEEDTKRVASIITPYTLTKTSGNNNNNSSSNTPRSSTGMERSLLYELPKCSIPPPSEFAAIETFVANAIQSQELSTPGTIIDPSHVEGYKGLIMALKRPSDPPMLRKVLLALRTAGHGRVLNQILLGGKHAQLIHLIIRFPSTRKPNRLEDLSLSSSSTVNVTELLSVYDDNSLCDAHFHLLLAIVSAKSTNVVPVLRAVWKLLTAYGPLNDAQTERMHAMLYNTLRLVPKATSDVFPIISQKFPFWTRKADDLIWYTQQTLKVLDYVPTVRQKVFELLIDKCLEIDVNIFIKDNGDAIIEEEEKEKDEEEVQDGRPKDNNVDHDKEQSTGKAVRTDDTVDELSDKLDALLELLFLQIQASSNHTVAGARRVFYELLPIFESSILTTHKSKFVQYVMFLSCGLETQAREMKGPFAAASGAQDGNSSSNDDNDGMDASPLRHCQSEQHPNHGSGGDDDDEEDILNRDFASKMLEIIVDPYRANTTRQSCACYLASFISRASFVGAETVCESVSALLRWAEAYVGSLDVYSIRAADSREQSDRHAVFYTVCQAAFYIMCFRGKEAMEFYQNVVVANQQVEEGLPPQEAVVVLEGHPEMEFMNLNRDRWTYLCSHELQPLRFCLESVRDEFLHVAHFFDLLEPKVLAGLVVDAKKWSTGGTNKRVAAAKAISTSATLERRRQNGGVGGLGRGSNPLKSFFPFDPLLLRRSHQLIEPFYKHWQGPVEDDDMLDHDDVDDDDEVGGGGVDVEPMFAMDDAMGDSEEGSVDGGGEDEEEEEEDDNESDSDDDDESDDEEMTSRDVSDGVSHPGPNAGYPIYSTADGDGMKTPDAYEQKLLQQKAWTETLKRPRSQSLENGSW